MAVGSEIDRVLILNPASGSGDHASEVRTLGVDHGFDVRETSGAGDAVELAYDAAERADLVAACGGDGTINEVVTGLRAAGALDDVELCVVPGGTGNNFAGNVGVESIEHAFEVVESGETRRLDLGLVETPTETAPPGPASEWVFVNSCICGLTAQASGETTTESKSQFGTLAYVVETLKQAVEFDGLPLAVEPTGESGWSGDALVLLVGNARRFPESGRTQANVEDGEFDVAVIEERPTVDLTGDAVRTRLFGGDAAHLRRLHAPSLTVSVQDGETGFSLDGEMLSAERVRLQTAPGALAVRVGDAYEPTPD